MPAKNAPMICKCCFMKVRQSSITGAWFHENGVPEIETIAREIMPDNGLLTPMRPVIPSDRSAIEIMSYPTRESRKQREAKRIRDIRIVNGRL